jgi:hypothetical protein
MHHKRQQGIGPGGIRCNCCRPVERKRVKQYLNRRYRRVTKQEKPDVQDEV